MISVFVIYEASVYCEDWCTVLCGSMPFLFLRLHECRRREVILPLYAGKGGIWICSGLRDRYTDLSAFGEKITFASEEDALKIGRLVCRKLAEKQPPTVSREEIVENLPSMHLPVAGR